MSYLKILAIELENIMPEKYVYPTDEIDPDCDRAVGEASGEFKKMFTLRRRLTEGEKEIMIQGVRDEGLTKELAAKLYELKYRKNVLERNMWLSAIAQFNLWADDMEEDKAIGIRKGFIVVVTTPNKPRGIVIGPFPFPFTL